MRVRASCLGAAAQLTAPDCCQIQSGIPGNFAESGTMLWLERPPDPGRIRFGRRIRPLRVIHAPRFSGRRNRGAWCSGGPGVNLSNQPDNQERAEDESRHDAHRPVLGKPLKITTVVRRRPSPHCKQDAHARTLAPAEERCNRLRIGNRSIRALTADRTDMVRTCAAELRMRPGTARSLSCIARARRRSGPRSFSGSCCL